MSQYFDINKRLFQNGGQSKLPFITSVYIFVQLKVVLTFDPMMIQCGFVGGWSGGFFCMRYLRQLITDFDDSFTGRMVPYKFN